MAKNKNNKKPKKTVSNIDDFGSAQNVVTPNNYNELKSKTNNKATNKNKINDCKG